jgi:hypothetical protein
VPDSTFYNAGNVAVNVAPSRISLSNYIRNQSLGTVKVNVNGSTSATDGPQVSDIKNWILSMNPHLDEAFLNCISVSNINVQNTYEYAATITCDTETVNFIDPNNNTIAVNFFGIQEDNLATYKVDSTTGAKT